MPIIGAAKYWRSSLVSVVVFMSTVSCAIAFRAILPSRALVNENSDYVSFYEPVARRILDGRGAVSRDDSPATRYGPGYPLLLAGVFAAARFTGISEQAAVIGFAYFGLGLAAVLVFALSATVWPPRFAVLAPALFMTYPLALWLTKQPNSEIAFMPVLYGSALLLWSGLRTRRHMAMFCLGCGILAGCAMMIRPIAVGVALPLAVVTWRLNRDLRRWTRLAMVSLILVGNLAVVLPWGLWVYSRTGHLIFVSSGGVARLRDGLAFAGSRKSWREPIWTSGSLAALMRDIEGRYGELRSVADVVSLLGRELSDRPLAVAELFAWKVVRSWYATDSRRFESVILLIQLPYLALIAWSTAAALRCGGIQRKLVISAWALGVYFWGIAVLAMSIVRYMVPAIGLLFTAVPAIFAKEPQDECVGAAAKA